MLEAVAEAADPAADLEIVHRDVTGTAEKIKAGEIVTGGTRLAGLLTGDGKAVVRRLRQWLGLMTEAEPRWIPPDDRPVVIVDRYGLAELAEIVWQAIDAANTPARLYRYGSTLAWLSERREWTTGDRAARARASAASPERGRHVREGSRAREEAGLSPGPPGGGPARDLQPPRPATPRAGRARPGVHE